MGLSGGAFLTAVFGAPGVLLGPWQLHARTALIPAHEVSAICTLQPSLEENDAEVGIRATLRPLNHLCVPSKWGPNIFGRGSWGLTDDTPNEP